MLPFVFLLTGLEDLDFKEHLYMTYRVGMLTYTVHILRREYSDISHSPKHDAEDIVSETFWKVFRNIELIDQNRSEGEIKAYLFTVLRHRIYDHFRAKKPHITLEDSDGSEWDDGIDDVFERIAVSEENKLVKRAIARLPEPYASTLSLHYITDIKPKQIADILDIPLSTVYSRICEGKRKLALYLKEEGVNVDEYK